MEEFMKTMDEFYSTDWPDQITIDSIWRCEPPRTDSKLGVEFFIHYDGYKLAFDRLIDSSIHQADLTKQFKHRSLAEDSTLYLHQSLVTQWSEETTRAFPTNPPYRIYRSIVFGNDKAVIAKITSTIREEMKAFRKQFSDEQVLLEATWIHGRGKTAKKRAAADTACSWHSGICLPRVYYGPMASQVVRARHAAVPTTVPCEAPTILHKWAGGVRQLPRQDPMRARVRADLLRR